LISHSRPAPRRQDREGNSKTS